MTRVRKRDVRESDTAAPTLRHSLRHVTRVFHARFRGELMRDGLSGAEYEALFALRRVPGMSSAELARWNRVSPQNANQVLKQLVERGLVVRGPAKGHGRILESKLTPSGMRLVKAAEGAGAAIEAEMTSEMTAEEIEQLRTLLARAATALGSPIGAGLSTPSRLRPAPQLDDD